MIPRSILLGAVAATAVVNAHASDGAGPIEVTFPWIRTPPSAAPTAAGYATIANRGKAADRLISVDSPTARAVELHEMSIAAGVMRMRALPDGLAIGPGQTLVLSPGGDHLMLIGPVHALREGEKVPVTLRFAHAGKLTVQFQVLKYAPGARH